MKSERFVSAMDYVEMYNIQGSALKISFKMFCTWTDSSIIYRQWNTIQHLWDYTRWTGKKCVTWAEKKYFLKFCYYHSRAHSLQH